MNQIQWAIPEVPLPLVERRGHRVAIGRQAEHTAVRQRTPYYTAPPLAAHEPLEVAFFGILGEFHAKLGIGLRTLLSLDVNRVEIAHGANLRIERSGTRTLQMKKLPGGGF